MKPKIPRSEKILKKKPLKKVSSKVQIDLEGKY